jgi:hypothetical protein
MRILTLTALVLLSACAPADSGRARYPTLRFTASAVVEGPDPGVIVVEVTVANAGDAPVTLRHAACPVILHAYRDPARRGLLTWRSENHVAGSEPATCVEGEQETSIAPGSTSGPGRFRYEVPVTAFLGDSLPTWTYGFEALLLLSAGPASPPDTVRVPAGALLLGAGAGG